MEAASAATMDMKPNVRTSDVHVNRKQARMTAHRSSGLLHRLWVLLTRYAHTLRNPCQSAELVQDLPMVFLVSCYLSMSYDNERPQ